MRVEEGDGEPEGVVGLGMSASTLRGRARFVTENFSLALAGSIHVRPGVESDHVIVVRNVNVCEHSAGLNGGMF